MNVAVLSLTRDRLDYTKHCFQTLRENAGIEFDHHVHDNGSKDGSVEWLTAERYAGRIQSLVTAPRNEGIYGPLNAMLCSIGASYDVVVNFDNDCKVVTPGTLKAVCEFAVAHPGAVVGPVVRGLRHPPRVQRIAFVDGQQVYVTPAIGGIFMPIPAGWRYPEGDRYIHADGLVCADARRKGNLVGQLVDFEVNHYETTDGQQARYPEYFERRRAEGIPD